MKPPHSGVAWAAETLPATRNVEAVMNDASALARNAAAISSVLD
jgi:hypothetical protein